MSANTLHGRNTCVKACNNDFEDARKNEEERHKDALRSCRLRQGVQKSRGPHKDIKAPRGRQEGMQAEVLQRGQRRRRVASPDTSGNDRARRVPGPVRSLPKTSAGASWTPLRGPTCTISSVAFSSAVAGS